MIAYKKQFALGISMLIGFAGVLIIMFLPIISGLNSLEYLDKLYNSISKYSAYYIPEVKSESEAYAGKTVNVTLAVHDGQEAEQAALILTKSGASVNISDNQLNVTGDLGKMLGALMTDAEEMYNNEDRSIREKYGLDGRRALYTWFQALEEMDKGLRKQKEFDKAKMVSTVLQKVIEPSYNYYGVTPEKITAKLGVTLFSLVFYVVYTLWYGFAIMYIFEGLGFRFEH